MNRILLPLFLLFCVAVVPPSFADDPPTAKDSDLISYRRLTWDDFRVDDKAPGMAAQTHTFITFSFRSRIAGHDGAFTASATDLTFVGGFDRKRSWRRSSVSEQNEQLLAHEQGHFDLEELKLRQFRRWKVQDLPQGHGTTSDLAYDDLKKRLQALYHTEVDDLEKMQRQYDEETNHGTRREIQEQWTQRINHALQLLPPLPAKQNS
jgi:hypothetical protein